MFPLEWCAAQILGPTGPPERRDTTDGVPTGHQVLTDEYCVVAGGGQHSGIGCAGDAGFGNADHTCGHLGRHPDRASARRQEAAIQMRKHGR